MSAELSSLDLQVELRPVEIQDEPFLFGVYASSRARELAETGWNERLQIAFLQHQYTAQRDHYHSHYPRAKHEIVIAAGEPVGRLWVERNEDEVRILDLVVLTAQQRRGIGTYLLKGLQAEAQNALTPLRVHVETNNPSLGMFERLGFRIEEDKGPHLLLAWEPISKT